MFFKKEKEDMWLVAGLGNPGKEYDGTRHNAGFMAVDVFCKDNAIELNKKKFEAFYGEGKIGNSRVIAVKPQTFMNNSGEAVGKLARFYKIPNERIIVISDDISLDVGKIRVRAKGSAGGHNGLKSIIAHLSGEDFPRVKIGVGKKPNVQYDLVSWVLGKLPKEKSEEFGDALKRASGAVETVIKADIPTAMNRFNG